MRRRWVAVDALFGDDGYADIPRVGGASAIATDRIFKKAFFR
jgi:hypothetical protein